MHSVKIKNARLCWRPAAYPSHINYLACKGAFGIVLVIGKGRRLAEIQMLMTKEVMHDKKSLALFSADRDSVRLSFLRLRHDANSEIRPAGIQWACRLRHVPPDE